jgi:lipopolysaccharide biosynthesis protein
MRVKSIHFSKWLSVALVIGLGWYLYTKPMTQDRDVARFIKGKNTAIFAAYSPDGYVPHYVITYLRALKEVAPNIIFVTDNPLSLKAVHKISPYVTHVLAKRHGEYDWGSYKRGFQWLKEKGYAHKAASLILANDSVLMVTPSLKPIFEKMVGQADFWGITANQDYQYHLQSYFIVLEPKVYLNPQFETYLNSVTKQPDGLTVAVRYEVPFTKFLEDLGFSHEAYIPYKDLEYLELNDKNCYPLTMLSKHHAPFLKMRTFTTRLNIQEPKRLVLEWLKRNRPEVYYELTTHLKNINAL